MEEILARSFDLRLPGILKIREQGNAAWYAIEPLEPGYGVTIAHALLRVAQSSLGGAAVTAIRMNDIVEGTCLLGVEETMIESILNVKQMRVRSLSRQSTHIYLDAHGKRRVSAADLVMPDTIEILNPELHIATLENEHAHLTMELMIETGRGYVPADVKADQPIGFIPVDAIYTPIRKAAYTIEHARVGNMSNFEKIVFEIETDGTLSPEEALNQSGEILVQQFFPFTTGSDASEGDEHAITSSLVLILRDIYDLPIKALNLSARSSNSFKRKGITKVGQILLLDEASLRSIRSFGEKSIPPLIEALQKNGCFAPLFVSDTSDPK